MEDVKINSFTVGGIKSPVITIRGYKKDNISFVALVDGIEYKLEEEIILGRDFALKKVKFKNKLVEFVCSIQIPVKSSEIVIYQVAGDTRKLLFKKKTNLTMRVLSKIWYEFIMIPTRVKRIVGIIKKFFKVMKRHHFILSFKLIKRYLHSAKNNLGANNVTDFYYDPLEQNDYLKWLKERDDEIDYQEFKYRPLISIIVPVYNVDRVYLKECVESVLNQSYSNFELILVDDCSNKEETKTTLKEYSKNKKIKVVYRKKNGHISEATNTGIKEAKGEFISLLDNDDVLNKDALYYVVDALNKNKKLDMIYTDEDKIYFNGKYYFPHFKPDFSPDTLLSSNYICHFTTLRKSIVEEIGGFRSEYNGSQDYDLFLRFTEKTNQIYHVPKILYHWRMIPSSTAASGDSKNYAYIAGQKALEDTLKRRKIKGNVNLIGTPQMYDIDYLYDKEPRISIIIPTKDKADLVDKCLKSIYNKTDYKNFEIIVVSNNSQEKELFKLLKNYKRKYNNFKYIEINCEFNYSFLNNEAVKKCTGDYIVLLNNDIEIISENWLSKMVGYAMQKHVGCVGIKLLYPTLTIQHAGVVLGGGGIAAHAFVGTGDEHFGYFGRLVATYDYGAVTAACLMVQKSKFNEVEGLDENLKVAYNDVDFNLKLLEKGYYNVMLPSIKAIHYESISRGNDLDAKNKDRFINEITYMANKWGEKVIEDRFYNSNMSYYYLFHLDKKEIGEEDEK